MTPESARLTDTDYWARRHRAMPAALEGAWLYDRELHAFMPRGEKLSCFEVGVYPGKHLLYLAEKYGYSVTGIDTSPFLSRLESVFCGRGIEVTLVQADFLEWEGECQFDIVISHGFVEHFDEYQKVIERHWSFVKPGGLMVLSVPVLTPLQRAVRLLAYTSDQWRRILDSHNTGIMSLKALRDAAQKCRESEILVARHVNWMTVWFGPGSPGVRRWTGPIFVPLRLMERLVRRLDISNGLISPEALVAARKSLSADCLSDRRGPEISIDAIA